MRTFTEIQKAIEELAPHEKQELRDWLVTESEWAALGQERTRPVASGEGDMTGETNAQS